MTETVKSRGIDRMFITSGLAMTLTGFLAAMGETTAAIIMAFVVLVATATVGVVLAPELLRWRRPLFSGRHQVVVGLSQEPSDNAQRQYGEARGELPGAVPSEAGNGNTGSFSKDTPLPQLGTGIKTTQRELRCRSANEKRKRAATQHPKGRQPSRVRLVGH